MYSSRVEDHHYLRKMPTQRELRRLRALELYDHTGSRVQVQRRFQVKRGTLKRWLEQRAQEGHVHKRARTGRPHVLSQLQRRRMVRMLTDQRMSSRRVASHLSEAGIQVSQSTIVREAQRTGLHLVKEIQKPVLTDAQKSKRLAWCHNNVHTNWKTFLFSYSAMRLNSSKRVLLVKCTFVVMEKFQSMKDIKCLPRKSSGRYVLQ